MAARTDAEAGESGGAGSARPSLPRELLAEFAQALPRDELANRLTQLRAQFAGLRIVLANGCFEVLHVGHVRYLRDARSRGDFLVVALNADRGVQSLKGADRSLIPFEERAELLLALECVDAVTGFDELTLEATLRLLQPAVHAKGTDYTAQNLPERFVDQELGIEIAICGDPKNHSSTALIQKIAERARFDETR